MRGAVIPTSVYKGISDHLHTKTWIYSSTLHVFIKVLQGTGRIIGDYFMGMSAAEMTYYIAKAGDLIKGKGKGDMNTGAKVILGATTLIGGGIALGSEKIVRIIQKKRRKNR